MGALLRGRWLGPRALRSGYAPSGDGVVPFSTGLIDDIIAAGGAAPMRALYMHRLYSNYTGNICRVRRASDSVEANIGATAAGLLDTAAIAAHCGASDGFVVTWYDQSGNARDHTQATPSEQPKIYDGATGLTLTHGVALNPAPLFTRASAQSLARAGILGAASDYTAFWIGAGGTTGTQAWVSHDSLRLGSATSNKILYLSGGGTNRQFTPVTAVTTVGSYLCSFAAADLHTTIGIEQNGTNLAQASVAGVGAAVAFSGVNASVGSQSDGSPNAQQGPFVALLEWPSVLNATLKQICRDFGADNI
jgi:hypothetical protein